MIDHEFARAFAEEWIAAWNAHDLERILSHYADDFEMRSPLIAERMGEPSGRLRGKAAIRPYWAQGLARETLRFTLVDVLAGADSIAILYHRETGRLVAEVIELDAARRAVRGIAHYAHDGDGRSDRR
jgi:ketosteroid isomerase-like protein